MCIRDRDEQARVRLMGRAAAGSRAVLERLAAAGLELHLQIVLCPGWNDGEMLAETVEGAAGLPAVADLGVVPVSLAEEGDLRRVGAADAEAVLGAVGEWQERFRAARGAAFVHAADELHLLCGRTPPASDAPDQYENGIGMSAQLLEEARELPAVRELPDMRAPGEEGHERGPVSAVRLLTGTLAAPVVARAGEALGARLGVPVRPFAVANRLFGAHVTVTGLLGGRDVLAGLRDEPLAAGEWLVAPRVFMPEDLGRTLDDVGEEELAAACGGRQIFTASLREAFATLSR